jgi:hypothetical protein
MMPLSFVVGTIAPCRTAMFVWVLDGSSAAAGKVCSSLQRLLHRSNPISPKGLHPFRLLGVGESLVRQRHGA